MTELLNDYLVIFFFFVDECRIILFVDCRVDLVQRGIFTIVVEILPYRTDRYYYYDYYYDDYFVCE